MNPEIPLSNENKIELAEKASKMNIILIGPPGSGKSTFVRNLSDLSKDILYISTGEITRRRIAEGGEIAEKIEQLYLTGQAWPDDFVASLVLPDLINAKSRGFILDGIPRKLSEVEMLARILQENEINIDMTVNLYSSYETSLRRIEERMALEDQRPENLDHYKVRLDMYWAAVPAMREVLGSMSRLVECDTDQVNAEGVLNTFLSEVKIK